MRLSLKACFILLPIVMTACFHPPRISASISLKRKAAEAVSVVLKVKNLENRATTPILIDLTAQIQTANQWSQAQSILHPAAFALNRAEEHTITARLPPQAQAIRAILTVKEAETGRLVLSQSRYIAAVSSFQGSP